MLDRRLASLLAVAQTPAIKIQRMVPGSFPHCEGLPSTAELERSATEG
jgi:hypothetical protein